jgi:hypothetical protein
MWPAIIVAMENSLATAKNATKRAKLTGYLKRLRNFRLIMKVGGYLDILEKVVPASKVW